MQTLTDMSQYLKYIHFYPQHLFQSKEKNYVKYM